MQVIISIWFLTTKKNKHKRKNPECVTPTETKRHLFCITGFGESVLGSLDHGKELKIRGRKSGFSCHLLNLENMFMQLLPTHPSDKTP